MQTGAPGSPGRNDALRIMIIDDHEISRAAFGALLRSEGADVVADLRAGREALAMARALRPDVVIVDVTPAADTGFAIACRLRSLLPAPPIVILTSSTDRTRFGARFDGHVFIAKADICFRRHRPARKIPRNGRPGITQSLTKGGRYRAG